MAHDIIIMISRMILVMVTTRALNGSVRIRYGTTSCAAGVPRGHRPITCPVTAGQIVHHDRYQHFLDGMRNVNSGFHNN